MTTTTPGARDLHSPTKTPYTQPTPPGDQLAGGSDYNQTIMDWVVLRLAEPPPQFAAAAPTLSAWGLLLLATLLPGLALYCVGRLAARRKI